MKYFAPSTQENLLIKSLTPKGDKKSRFWTSPAIDIGGTIYIGNNDGYLWPINSNSFGLASSTWPKFRRDNKNRGRLIP